MASIDDLTKTEGKLVRKKPTGKAVFDIGIRMKI
jgi:hypothetical protein